MQPTMTACLSTVGNRRVLSQQLSSSSVVSYYLHRECSPSSSKSSIYNMQDGIKLYLLPSRLSYFVIAYFGVESRLHHLEKTHHRCFISLMIAPSQDHLPLISMSLCSLIYIHIAHCFHRLLMTFWFQFVFITINRQVGFNKVVRLCQLVNELLLKVSECAEACLQAAIINIST